LDRAHRARGRAAAQHHGVAEETPPVAELSALGVARISLAVWPFEFVRAKLRSAVDEFTRTRDFRIFLPERANA
jgi:2-methylisocitrate lyase-like PEP mutase family enzyme